MHNTARSSSDNIPPVPAPPDNNCSYCNASRSSSDNIPPVPAPPDNNRSYCNASNEERNVSRTVCDGHQVFHSTATQGSDNKAHGQASRYLCVNKGSTCGSERDKDGHGWVWLPAGVRTFAPPPPNIPLIMFRH